MAHGRKNLGLSFRDMFVQVSLQRNGAGPADALEISEALREAGFRHVAVVSSGSELRDLWRDVPERPVRWFGTPKGTFWGFLAATIFGFGWLKLFRLVKSLKPRLVFVTHVHPWVLPLGFFKRALGATLVCAAHENPFEPKEHDGALSLWMQRTLLARADVVVTYSRYTAGLLSKHLPDARVLCVPLGPYRHLVPAEEVGVSDELLFVGRLEAHKGLAVLADAFLRLKVTHHGARLTVAGRGNISDEVGGKLGSAGVRVLNRWLSHREVGELVARAYAVVLPYTQATQSGVAALAAACGVPCVAARVGGLPEQIRDGENGLLFDPGDPASLALALGRLYAEPGLRARLASGAKRLAQNKLSWKSHTDALISLYNTSTDAR